MESGPVAFAKIISSGEVFPVRSRYNRGVGLDCNGFCMVVPHKDVVDSTKDEFKVSHEERELRIANIPPPTSRGLEQTVYCLSCEDHSTEKVLYSVLSDTYRWLCEPCAKKMFPDFKAANR